MTIEELASGFAKYWFGYDSPERDELAYRVAVEIRKAVEEEREHILKTLEGNGELARIQGRAEAFEEAAKIFMRLWNQYQKEGIDPIPFEIVAEIRARAKEVGK